MMRGAVVGSCAGSSERLSVKRSLSGDEKEDGSGDEAAAAGMWIGGEVTVFLVFRMDGW